MSTCITVQLGTLEFRTYMVTFPYTVSMYGMVGNTSICVAIYRNISIYGNTSKSLSCHYHIQLGEIQYDSYLNPEQFLEPVPYMVTV